MVGGAAVVLVALILIAMAVSGSNSVPAGGEAVIASPNDDRAFAVVTLSNGLKTLLVSDPLAEQGAAAADVGAGSWRDPPTLEGLAHFTEHMLFLGTVKYPSEDGYQKYLSANGGSSNAYTDTEHTNYYFDINWRHLGGGLDRFSQFFVAPLLKASAAAKEMNAIESEHHKNLQEDGWRMQQVIRTAGRPGTPVSRFSTGNLATLNKTGIADALEAFHSRHYVAQNMRAGVLGRESLHELHRMAEQTLGRIPRTTAEAKQRRAEAEGEARRLKRLSGRHGDADADEGKRRDDSAVKTAAAAGARGIVHRIRSRSASSFSETGASPVAVEPASFDWASLLQQRASSESRAASAQAPAAAPAEPPAADSAAEKDPEPAAAPEDGGKAAAGGAGGQEPAGDAKGTGDASAAPGDAKGTGGAVSESAARAATALAEAADEAIANNAKRGLPAAGVKPVIEEDWGSMELGPRAVFPPDRLNRLLRWRPVSDSNTVLLLFVLPPQQKIYRASPASHISSLLGDETEGSPLLYLKQELGIAESLGSGLDADASGYATFKVECNLSPAASKDAASVNAATKRIGEVIFAYLNMLRGPASSQEDADGNLQPPTAATALLSTKWRWEEQRSVAQAAFLFPSRSGSADMVSQAARDLHTTAAADMLGSPSRYLWDAELLNSTLGWLVPSNMITIVGSRTFSDEQVAEREPIYGTPIKNDPLPEDMAAAWANPAPIEALALPKRNAFVPTDLSVKPLGDDVSPFGPRDPYTPIPGSLEDAELDGNADIAAASAADGAAAARFRSSDEAGQGPPAASAAAQQASSEAETAARALLQREQQAGFPVISAGVQPLPPGAIAAWWRQDETFRRPTINVMLEVETPRVLESAASSVLTSLYISAIDDQLQADSYRAQEAGYVYSITKSSLVSGLSIAIGGFSEKLPQWLTVVLGGLRSAELDEKRFESHRGLLLQSLDNNEKTSKPYSRALYFYKTFVGENRFNIPELKKAVQSATLAAAKQHTKQLFEAARIVMLVHGNALQQDAAAISRIVSRAFAGVKILPESQALTSRAGARWIRGNRMIQRRVANPAEGDSATAVLHQLGLREDCFAGLVPDNATTNATTAPGDGTTNATTAPGDDDNTTNTTAPASASLLQRAGRHGARRAGHKLRRQEPIGVGSPSEDLGTDGEAATRMARSMGADDNTTSTIGEAVRKRECVVRELTATLLGNALYQPAFETLRTKQQLGYLVFAGLTASPTMGASEQPSRAALASPALRRAGITVHSGLARRRGLHDHPVRAPGSAGSSLGSQAWSRSAALASAAQEAATAADALTSAPLTVRGDELQALYVMVEGPENSPALLDVRITQFLNKVNDTLEALAADPEEDGGVASSVWDSMVASQISSKLRKPMSLSEGTGTMWGEIAARTLRFQRSQEQLDVLRGGHVEMSDVVALYNSRVLDTANGAGRLSVQMFGADVPFETPMQAWEKDVKSTGRSAGQIPPECVTAVNVTDKDAINARLA